MQEWYREHASSGPNVLVSYMKWCNGFVLTVIFKSAMPAKISWFRIWWSFQLYFGLHFFFFFYTISLKMLTSGTINIKPVWRQSIRLENNNQVPIGKSPRNNNRAGTFIREVRVIKFQGNTVLQYILFVPVTVKHVSFMWVGNHVKHAE